MISYLPLPPLTVILGQWEFPIDPYVSTKKRIFKDKNRQIKVSLVDKTKYKVEIQYREMEEQFIPVKNNLWRVIQTHSPWRECINLELNEGFNKFVSQGMEFIGEIVIVTPQQVKIGIYYNEPRNVSAAEIGYNLHKISVIENGYNSTH